MITEKTIISEFAKEFNFDDIRPYYDPEVKSVLQKTIKDPLFMKLINYLWPEMTFAQVEEKASRVNSCMEFQMEFMNDAIHTIVRTTSDGLTYSGFDKLDPAIPYLYIANHRDIFLDAAILQIVLVANGFPTSEISFGDNLKAEGFTTVFGKLNRMFTVTRDGTSKELYEASRKLSAYIRHTLLDRNAAIWIAQRNGRTKDGMDITQPGLLKMLKASGDKNLTDNFAALRIVPITISYEYEPCDFFKTNELYQVQLHGKYTKAPGEDIQSIVTGIRQNKGKIHLTAGEVISREQLMSLEQLPNDNEKIKNLAAIIDKDIYKNYACRASNYYAADLLEGKSARNKFYTNEDKTKFDAYMNKGLSSIEGDRKILDQIFLKMYATPVFNQEH